MKGIQHGGAERTYRDCTSATFLKCWKPSNCVQLCALGTLGVAAAGFALGTADDSDLFLVKPGKRKAPGADIVRSTTSTKSSPINQRIVSQPAVLPPTLDDKTQPIISRSLFRRSTTRDYDSRSRPVDRNTESRGSSIARSSILRPWTAHSRSATPTSMDQKEPSVSTSWLKRMSTMSTMSSMHNSSPAPSVSEGEPGDSSRPNKLVKRSSSQRLLDDASAPPLRRPATSHQRSATLQYLPRHDTQMFQFTGSQKRAPITSPAPLWRPYFDIDHSRKRHTSGGLGEIGARVVSGSRTRQPVLVLGPSVQPSDNLADQDARDIPEPLLTVQPVSRRQKFRGSLGSVRRGAGARQRNFTDPVLSTSNGPKPELLKQVVKSSPLSPLSTSSAFDVTFPRGTPSFTSSPQFAPSQHAVPRYKRHSVAPSVPTTASSDNDTRIFTDDESMDFQSDTAYDSLATRATASSHSMLRAPKIETIFDELPTCNGSADVATLEDLMHKTTLKEPGTISEDSFGEEMENVGIGISGLDGSEGHDVEKRRFQATTPKRSDSFDTEDFAATPVPIRRHLSGVNFNSSPPPMPRSHSLAERSFDDIQDMVERMDVDENEEINWSPKSDMVRTEREIFRLPILSEHISWSPIEEKDTDTLTNDKRSSIFDWSENLRIQAGVSDGPSPRPKTVHGKQGNDGPRSRPHGRKSQGAMHLRSQSVPVNRDSLTENESLSAAKFGTWGLGNKPVSEEWSDDFEFDDGDDMVEAPPLVVISHDVPSMQKDSIRSVKVPQSIIDRQASVHLQFGQVQEFMLLVEELKRLRVQGSTLQLLGTHSKQLWLDAEAIVNLATLNDDEDGLQRPPSPTSSDIFGDETPPPDRSARNSMAKIDDEKRNSVSRRSVSNPATPPFGRPRGESLAQAKTILQTIHQNRAVPDLSPHEPQREKLPFDTQDLRDLVVRAGVITRALKEIVRKAEGVSVSPNKTPKRNQDPAFSQIFNAPDNSPCPPPFKTPKLPHSRSANSYLGGPVSSDSDREFSPSLKLTAVV